MRRKQQLRFEEWWRLVLKLWRNGGQTASIPEVRLRRLYDDRYSPLEASERLLRDMHRASSVESADSKEHGNG